MSIGRRIELRRASEMHRQPFTHVRDANARESRGGGQGPTVAHPQDQRIAIDRCLDPNINGPVMPGEAMHDGIFGQRLQDQARNPDVWKLLVGWKFHG